VCVRVFYSYVVIVAWQLIHRYIVQDDVPVPCFVVRSLSGRPNVIVCGFYTPGGNRLEMLTEVMYAY
jgi:hypothetical protein